MSRSAGGAAPFLMFEPMRISPPVLKNGAFGLTELLVSLLIVVTLAALLFPAFRYTREVGYSGRCTRQLQAIYSAAIAFSFDHQGKLPPALGSESMAKIDARFSRNQYWWGRYYLASYLVPQSQRNGSNILTQEEAGVFNCPARFKDGPDEQWQRTNAPGISYVMRTLGTSSPDRYRLVNMKEASQKVYITEGRSSTMGLANARSATLGTTGESNARLRRYHRGGLNLLFFDGHVESFFDSDEALQPMIELDE